MAWTIAWECTAGKFEWTYDIDEVVHVVEGGMWLEDGHSPKRFVGAGEVVFFPAGSRAVWTVDDYVRKVAFCKRALPNAVSLMVRALRKARTMMSRGPGEGGALLSA
ncbi:MAG: DUF861 domain-containing protein [Hyphomicrobiales bacterium]|nr:DUF861 domain-containing protein [Hyphomicrobiales bacterium]